MYFCLFSLLAALAAVQCSRPAGVTASSVSCDTDDEEESALLQTSKRAVAPLSTHTAPGEFRVLDVGPPRTGTQSMSIALERLGYSPCHSGYHDEVRETLCSFALGKGGTFDEVTELMADGGWDSGMDEPFHLIYEDVMKHWPNSKFILPDKEPEDWYQSYLHWFDANQWAMIAGPLVDKIEKAMPAEPETALGRHWRHWGALMGYEYGCTGAAYFGCDFEEKNAPRNETKEACIAGYTAHVERVKQVVPPEKLLLFNISEGYPPLCEFLGQEVPTFPNGTVEPFPHVDKYTEDSFPDWDKLQEGYFQGVHTTKAEHEQT